MHQTTRSLNSVLLFTACTTLVGCALPPHNNTLIFATTRKVGIDITPTNATHAGLTIGYSANELAWVPLWANGGDGKPMHCKDVVQTDGQSTRETMLQKCPNGLSPKFVGRDEDGASKGKPKDEDAYSTFASFGGTVSAKAGADQPTGSFNIASVFATGIAAQNFAAQGQWLVATAAQTSKSEEPSLALVDAKKQLLKFLTLTASNSSSASASPQTSEACLQKLGAMYEGQKSERFVWLKARTPKEATDALLANTLWREAELNKLNGIAYQLSALVQQEIEQAKSNAKATPPNAQEPLTPEQAIAKQCA